MSIAVEEYTKSNKNFLKKFIYNYIKKILGGGFKWSQVTGKIKYAQKGGF